MICPKCNNTGWYKYDHNHSTVCNLCCKHDKGWWILSACHGKENAGKWCCGAGCGKKLTYKEVIKRLKKEFGYYPIFINGRKN